MSTITVTLRPTATLRSVQQTVHGAATVDAATSDDSDSSYSTSLVNGFAKVQFPGYTLPVGAVVNGVTVRLRMQSTGASTVTTLLNGNSTGSFPFHPAINVWRTDTGFPVGGISAQAVANGLALQWTNGPGSQTSVAEAYLDIEAVPRPVVTVLEPNAAVDTSQPEIGWQTAGDYPQAQYQVKIFSEDQYTAPGFSPTDSAAFFDSAVLTGTDDTFTATAVNLTNGIRYRFYVRVAQIVPATGNAQWSAWDFTEQPVSVPAPDVPTVTAEPDDANARIKLTITDSFTPPPSSLGYGLDPYGLTPYGSPVGAGSGTGGGGTWQFVTVQRSSDGGLTWNLVRFANRAPVFGATFTIYDYEACNSVDVIYRAQAIAVVGAGDVASDFSTPTAPVQWASALTWLKSPTLPAANTPVMINSLPTLTKRKPQGSFDVEGREDPVVVSDARKLPTGTITFVTLALTTRDAVQQLLDRSEPLLLQTPPEADFGCRYLEFGDVDENRATPTVATETTRLIVCPFQQVLAPAVVAGDVGGSAITWQTVLRRFTTWNDLGSVGTWEQVLELTS